MKYYLIALGLIAAILTGCGAEEEPTPSDENAEQIQEEENQTEQTEEAEVNNEDGFGYVGDYGKVTVISEADPFVLEGNESVDYELSDVKVIKLEDYTEDGQWGLLWGTGAENFEELPESVYAVIGTEKKMNKTDMSIEFTGVHTMAAGTEQIDLISEDFVVEDEGGSTMLGGVKAEGQFGVVIEDPEIESVKFVLSSAFDSETFSNDLLTEQEIELPLVKK